MEFEYQVLHYRDGAWTIFVRVEDTIYHAFYDTEQQTLDRLKEMGISKARIDYAIQYARRSVAA